MSRLLFVRHAETDMAEKFCGHSDPQVNARGHQQIQTLIRSLGSAWLDAIYTSDLQRAATTAHALAEPFGITPVRSTQLREIHFGEWEGLSWQEIEQKHPAIAQRWMENYPALPAPGGEPFNNFQARVLAELRRLLALPGRIAVVTHAGVMRVALRSLCGLSEQQAWDRTHDYCCFFEYSGEAMR